MRLSKKQSDFFGMVMDLANHIRPVIENNGVLLKVTEWNRTIETQRRYVAEGLSKTLHSKHILGLAVDFALIKQGKYLTESPIYDMMGNYWEGIGGKWGGRFKILDDKYHFEYNQKRRKKYLEEIKLQIKRKGGPNKDSITYNDKQYDPIDLPKTKVKLHNKIWMFLNGKKMLIGLGLWGVGLILSGPVAIWLRTAGQVMTAGGTTHKVKKGLKKLNEKTSGEKINWGEIWEMLIKFIKKLFGRR